MKRLIGLSIILLFAALTTGCDAFRTLSDANIKTSQGKPYELILVCPQAEWTGEVGDTLRAILTAPVPYINQTEPLFDVLRVTERGFRNMIAEHRNILKVLVDPSVKETTVAVQYDVTAQPQVVLTLQGPDDRSVVEYLSQHRAELVRVLEMAERDRDVVLCKIYEDNILGKLSDSRYATLDAQYEKEQSELTAEISVLEKAVKSYEKHEKDADRFIALIDKYENFDKLTIAMLNEFIEKILVHERDRKGSIQTTQEVEIYFNFVGRFVPPAFGEVELTPEELEEIRKREERKDRLHQNYLKRKASGAQKRYEDKIKAKKKAEMDAKKALIRAEDMKKGVFSTIGQLPKEEPRKGSIAASAAV